MFSSPRAWVAFAKWSLLASLAINTGCGTSKLFQKETTKVGQDVEELDPGPTKPTAKMYSDFGNVYLGTRNLPRAEYYFNEALKLDKNFDGAYAGLARCYAEAGRHDAALAQIQSGLNKSPNSAELWNELGVIHAKKGQYAQAIESTNKAIAINGTISKYNENLGSYLAMSGKYDEAIWTYGRTLDPAEAKYRVAGILNATGKPAAAQQLLAQAVKENPKHKGAITALRKFSARDIQTVNYTSSDGVSSAP